MNMKQDRIGSTDDPPAELIAELKPNKVSRREAVIKTIDYLGGRASTDEILVNQYRLFGFIGKRTALCTLLYKSQKEGKVIGKGGIWSIKKAEVAEQ